MYTEAPGSMATGAAKEDSRFREGDRNLRLVYDDDDDDEEDSVLSQARSLRIFDVCVHEAHRRQRPTLFVSGD